MSRFKELTSAPAASSSDAPADSSRLTERNADRPRPADAVADATPGRKSLFGGAGPRTASRDAASRYRDEYAEVSRKVLERSREPSRDPFLEQPNPPNTKPFPSTDELANVAQAGSPRRPGGADPTPGVVRTTASTDRTGIIDPVSLERTQPPAIARTGVDPNSSSRLEELRAELRRQQATPPDARPATAGGINARPGPNDRGYGLSVQPQEPPAVVKLTADHAGSAAAPPQAAAPPVTPPPTPNAGSEEIWLRVQSLLAAAEWLADRGDLEEAYRNAMLAQHLTEHAHLQFKPGDRQPSEVGQRIWEALHRREDSAAIAQQLPKPRLPSAAHQQPLPDGAFPIQDRLGWTKSEGPSSLIADANAMPVIVPRPGAGPAVAAAPPTDPKKTPAAAGPPVAKATPPVPATPPAQAKAGPVVPPAVAKAPPQPPAAAGPKLAAGPGNPVTLAAIEAPPVPKAPAEQPVVTALAETPAAPNAAAGAAAGSAEPAGFTVPAMATMPRTAAPPTPAGPALARVPKERAAPAPPNLEVVAARRLQAISTQTESNRRFPGAIWGLGGLVVGVVGAVWWSRRRRQPVAPPSAR